MRVPRASLFTFAAVVAIGASAWLEAIPLPPEAKTSGQTVAAGIATAPDQTLTADGVTLRYREVGAGEPVVLIHGYSASLESQIPLANALAPSHRVVAFDVRGFGKSSKFSESSRFGQLMVDDAVHLLDHLKITRAHVVGHSMGAVIAANLVARYPARVASATLIAGPFYPDKPTFTNETAQGLADLEGGRGMTDFVKWLMPAMDAKMVAGFSAQVLKANDLPSLIAVMRSLPDLAIAGLGATGMPVLVAVGTGDPLHPLSQQFAQSSPGSRLLEIVGANHITVVASAEFVQALRDLLERAQSRSGRAREAA
jgi:pimeloyl-ACP methyl ester carboxylesterase